MVSRVVLHVVITQTSCLHICLLCGCDNLSALESIFCGASPHEKHETSRCLILSLSTSQLHYPRQRTNQTSSNQKPNSESRISFYYHSFRVDLSDHKKGNGA